jgi:hypothetical protein
MRRAVVVTAVVGVLLPIAGGTAAASAPRVRASHPSSVSASQERARQWLTAQRAVFVRSGGFVSGGVVGIAGDLPDSSLLAAGDLNGDKHPDVLDVRSTDDSDTVGVTARTGSTGHALWSKQIGESPQSATIAVVLPTRIGASGRPGVLVAMANTTYGAEGPVAVSLQLRAFAGRTGHETWHRRYDGTYDGDFQTAIPTFEGLIHDVSGADSDVLVTLNDVALHTDTTTPNLVSDVDGTVHQPGDPLTTTPSNGIPTVQPIPDVSGDGLADLLLIVPGATGKVTAETGHDGVSLWTENLPATVQDPTVTSIGAFSQPKTVDLAFVGEPTPDVGPTVTIVQGSSGSVLWTRAAGAVVALGRAGSSLVRAVALESSGDTSTGQTDTATMAYEAISVSNQVLYDKSLTVATPMEPDEHFERYDATYQSFGDLQSDGSLDELVDLGVFSEAIGAGTSKVKIGVVNGRTGSFHAVPADGSADGSLHHGKASDLVDLTLSGTKLELTASDGVTRKRYYQRTLAGLPAVALASITGLRVSGHACSDLAVVTSDTNQGADAMLSARGAMLWKIHYPSAAATGGTLKRFKAPKHFCV